MAQRVPQSASFVYDAGVRSITEQLARIDSLDSKAGILLAADGILAGLIFVRGGVVASAPLAVALVVSASILLSLVCTLVSFADREYLTPPKAETVAQLAAAPQDWSSGASWGTSCVPWRRTANVCGARPGG